MDLLADLLCLIKKTAFCSAGLNSNKLVTTIIRRDVTKVPQIAMMIHVI